MQNWQTGELSRSRVSFTGQRLRCVSSSNVKASTCMHPGLCKDLSASQIHDVPGQSLNRVAKKMICGEAQAKRCVSRVQVYVKILHARCSSTLKTHDGKQGAIVFQHLQQHKVARGLPHYMHNQQFPGQQRTSSCGLD